MMVNDASVLDNYIFLHLSFMIAVHITIFKMILL